MHKIVLILALGLSAIYGWSQSLESVYEKIIENNIQLKQVGVNVQEARIKYAAAMNDLYPNLMFSTNESFNVSPVIPEGTYNNLRFSGVLTASQKLPTGGSIRMSVDTAGSSSSMEDDISWNFSNSSGFSIELRQPLFVNGQFIDTSFMAYSLEQNDITLSSAEFDLQLFKESLFSQLLSVVAQYRLIQLGSDLLIVNIDLAKELLRQAEQDFELGRGTQTDVIERSYTARTLEEQSINFDLSKLKLVQLFKHLSGLDVEKAVLEGLAQDVEALIPDIISVTPVEPDYFSNPDLIKLDDSYRSLELSGKRTDLNDAPVLGASFSYDTANGSGDDIQSAVLDSLEEDPDWRVDISLNWSWGLRSATQTSRETLALQLENLKLQRTSLLKNLKDTFQAKLLELEILKKTEALLQASLADDQERLGREQVRFDAGSGSSLIIKQLQADVRDRQIKIKENSWKQLQIHLEIYALSGIAVSRDIFKLP